MDTTYEFRACNSGVHVDLVTEAAGTVADSTWRRCALRLLGDFTVRSEAAPRTGSQAKECQ